MSRTPAPYEITVVRGATWEDFFDYADGSGVPVDLTGYEARMQIRSQYGQYGTTTEDTLVMELLSTGATPLLSVVNAPGSSVPNRVMILASPVQHAALNPDNERKAVYVYGLELYRPATEDEEEYIIPLVSGRLTVMGETVR